MTGWPDEWMTGWLDDRMTRWLDDQMTRWPDDQMTGSFADDWPYGIFWYHLLSAGYWAWVQCQYNPGISANVNLERLTECKIIECRSFLVVFFVLLFILLISNRGFFYLFLKNINWKEDLKNFIPWKIWVYLDYRVWSNVPHPRKMKRPNWSSIFEMIIWLNSWRSAFKSFN